jgi:hypothetical protein
VARTDVKRTATCGFGAATREKDFICMGTQIYYCVLKITMGLHGLGLGTFGYIICGVVCLD